MNINYRCELDNGVKEVTIKGVSELTEVNHISLWVPERMVAKKITAKIEYPISKDTRIFMNGYQTWTYSPEYGKNDVMMDFKGMPEAMIRKFDLDRYGDYHFVKYPKKIGRTHGFSYCYFREGEVFHLFASINERNGYTIFEYDSKRGILYLEKDCAGVKQDEDIACFDFVYLSGTEQEVFDRWFEELKIQPRTTEKMKGYSSWYNRYQDISEQSILTDLQGCAKVLDKGDLFQIDDGWEKAVGDWTCDEIKFPNGIKEACEKIHASGFKAGLWLAPFVAQKDSELVKNHPDWLLKHENEPWSNGSNWGGFYSLDFDHPEVIQYLKDVFHQVFDEWGFDLVKLDFLYGVAPFGNEKESRSGRMYRAMEFIREVCGDHLVLGCGVPVMPAFGLVDYCRVSCDVSLDWDDKPYMRAAHRERTSTKQAIETTLYRRQLNGRAYLSDPDVFFLRDENLKLTEEQKEELIHVCALFGGMFLNSDDMNEYNETKKAKYWQACHLREATDIRVVIDKEITVFFKLDGIGHWFNI